MTTEIFNVESLSAEDRNLIIHAIDEISDSMTRSAAEREFQKEAINNVHEQIGFDKKLLRKMAKVYNKQSFEAEKDSYSTFEEFYDSLLSNPILTS